MLDQKIKALKATDKFRVLALANYKAEKENTKTYENNDRWLKDPKWRNEKIESKLEEAYNEFMKGKVQNV